jgi:hypothetical protein
MANPGCIATVRGNEIPDDDDVLENPGEGVSFADPEVITL